MILAALVKRYENQAAEGKIPRQGWSKAKVAFGLRLSESGTIEGIVDLRTEVQSGKRTLLIAKDIEVPEQVKKSSGLVSNFLCENAKYLFGLDDNIKCFEVARKLHQDILSDCNSPTATAVKNFFEKWNLAEQENYHQLQCYTGELKKGALLAFMYDENFAFEDEEIKSAWEKYRRNQTSSLIMQCLITGEISPIARLHPSIKGVKNAQSSGASIISFNANAFESYGRAGEQGLNAPVSEYATFAYTTALNDLLSDSTHVKYFGDMTVAYWAEENSDACQNAFSDFLEAKELSDKTLNAIIEGIQKHNVNYDGVDLNFDNPFYILGLSPNSARLSIRFFLRKTFGEVIKNIAKHYADLKIIKSYFTKSDNIPLWQILAATIPPHAKEKSASPLMAGALVQAVMTGQNYPESLFQNVLHRTKFTHEVTYEQAAIIKAYLTRNKRRIISMALDENSTDKNYILGRIFSVFEDIQNKANPGLNATIKDKYFNAACTTPDRIFPNLHQLSIHHLKKLETGQKIYFEKKIGSLMEKLSPNEESSSILTPEEQGMFILGYYHQTRERYKSKEEREND